LRTRQKITEQRAEYGRRGYLGREKGGYTTRSDIDDIIRERRLLDYQKGHQP
jgi:hypothetical protein